MNILAIDPATKCGWAVSNEVYGCWDLKTRADESWGMKLVRMRSKLMEIHKAENIDVIVYERPAGMNVKPKLTQSKIIGVIEVFCVDNGIEYRAYSAGEIKKFATGKGNSNKEAMVEASRKYGYEGEDDNIADALHLLHLAEKEIL